MKTSVIFVTAILVLAIFSSAALATGKSWRQPSGVQDKDEVVKQDAQKEKAPKEEKKKPDTKPADIATDDELTPKEPMDFLLMMLSYEGHQGLLDYQVEIMEVSKSSVSNQSRSIRKVMLYLAPTRQLTLQDNIPIYYLDEYLFIRKMDQVDLQRINEDVVNGIPCYVIKMTPKEEAFAQNVKHYYLAKDDFRKIRIESIRINLAGQERYMVTDFNYRVVNGRYNLPINSESRMYDERDFLLETITATFMDWRINIGITAEFLNDKLKDYQLYDIVK